MNLDRFSRPIGINLATPDTVHVYGSTCGCDAKATETYNDKPWCSQCLSEYKADNGIVEEEEEIC